MALAAWLGAARCASATPERAHVTIAVGGKSLIAYLPVTLAQTLNLFAKHG